MANFKWRDDLKLSIDQFDTQHQQLLQMMDRLQTLAQTKAPKPQVTLALTQLFTATKTHFQGEETYMASIKFPRAEEHGMIHKNLLTKLEGFAKGYAAGTQELGAPFFAFLEFWIASHIRGVDRLYADHAATQKSAPAFRRAV